MNNRIKELRKKLNLKQATFGERIGISESAVCAFENGRRTPSEQSIKSICREFNVNYAWLVYGQGDMFNEHDDTTEKIDRILAGENETAIAVFKAFAELSEEEWAIVESIIDKIQKNKADTE